jgi:hypothetical protein
VVTVVQSAAGALFDSEEDDPLADPREDSLEDSFEDSEDDSLEGSDVLGVVEDFAVLESVT